MKIYFLIEIALLLAACLTAVIVTVKNAKLCKKVADRNISIIDLKNRLRISEKNNYDQKVIIGSQSAEIAKMREVTREVTKEMYEKIKKLYEARKELLEYLQMTREENIATLTAPLPERRNNETDAHFNQRCRQTVANKCAKYVSVSEKIISITILR
jgi:hypothetical protein